MYISLLILMTRLLGNAGMKRARQPLQWLLREDDDDDFHDLDGHEVIPMPTMPQDGILRIIRRNLVRDRQFAAGE